MQKASAFRKIVGSSVLTGLGLAGSLAAAFILGNQIFETMNAHVSGFLSGLAGFAFLLVCFAIGGTVWGYGLARLYNAPDPLQVARKAILAFAGITILAGIALEVVFGLISALGSGFPMPIHHAFTLVFVPTAGLIAALLGSRMGQWLHSAPPPHRSSLYIGLSAALAFLVVNLVMLQLGWKIGAPGAAERMTMITVMLLSNTGAALAGGAALGYVLQRREPHAIK
jgi:hypothetical protein